jgi:outer membrane biosynthesis protein TonB
MTTSPTIEEQTSNSSQLSSYKQQRKPLTAHIEEHDKKKSKEEQRKPLTAHIEEHDKKKSKEEQRKPLTAHIEEHDKKKSNIGLFNCLSAASLFEPTASKKDSVGASEVGVERSETSRSKSGTRY